MSYTPTEWKTGDVITAEKLNNIEQGIGDGGLPKNEPESSIKFGTAMIFNGTQWIKQDGYGVASKIYDTIILDGNTDGLDHVSVTNSGSTTTFYKVSDKVLTKQELIGSKIIFKTGLIEYLNTENMREGQGWINCSDVIFVISELNVSIEGVAITFPSTGIYFLDYIIPECPIEISNKTVQPFDADLLGNAIMYKDIILYAPDGTKIDSNWDKNNVPEYIYTNITQGDFGNAHILVFVGGYVASIEEDISTGTDVLNVHQTYAQVFFESSSGSDYKTPFYIAKNDSTSSIVEIPIVYGMDSYFNDDGVLCFAPHTVTT